ncbi:MAG: HAMP domain-containing sensor histidine kinase [Bacteroidales bacterium]
MSFNQFYFKLIITIIAISALGAFTIWSFSYDGLIVSRFILLILWMISILFFYRYIYNTTSIIKDFIINVKEGDLVFVPDSKNAFGKEFNELLSFLNQKIKTISIEKEEQYHLFKNAVNQSGSGIIVFDDSGKIELMNKSAFALFSLSNLKNISQLEQSNPELPKKLLTSKEKSFIIPIQVNNELQKIAIHQNNFILRGKKLKVVSMQNISAELDKEELESWKKLMHVITHEIMNSVTPMKTLAYSLFEMYKDNDKPKTIKEIDQHSIDDTFMGLKAINNRVHGLMRFVESYRKLYKIPEPIFCNFAFKEIVDELNHLFKDILKEKNIALNIRGEDDLKLFADKVMITQVMINLIKNAIDAVQETSSPEIIINTFLKLNEIIITVSDNGKGISTEELKDIFVPFYTTKKDGTGIGLYYSKMIIFMHKGQIRVNSEVNQGTTFSIHL